MLYILFCILNFPIIDVFRMVKHSSTMNFNGCIVPQLYKSTLINLIVYNYSLFKQYSINIMYIQKSEKPKY